MMKKIMMAPLFCLTSSIAGAQVEVPKPITCFPTTVLLKELRAMGNEPQWTGASPDGKSQFLLVVNKDKSWILVQFDEKLGCILGAGDASRMIFKMV